MKKLYYTIGEVSKLTGVEAHILRYWESKFSDLNPVKNSVGKRVYKEDHLQLILKLKELIVEQKYSTAGAKKIIEGENAEPIKVPKRKLVEKDLREIRELLLEIREKL